MSLEVSQVQKVITAGSTVQVSQLEYNRYESINLLLAIHRRLKKHLSRYVQSLKPHVW